MRELAKIAKEPIPPNLESEFRRLHRIYWDARVRWANELARNDPELFRHLVPCDPVVTVAPDVVLFECFSRDESSYGCRSVVRGAFKGVAGERPRDHERRFLARALRAFPDAPQLPADPAHRRSDRLRGERLGARGVPRGEDRSPPLVAARVRSDPGGDVPPLPPRGRPR